MYMGYQTDGKLYSDTFRQGLEVEKYIFDILLKLI